LFVFKVHNLGRVCCHPTTLPEYLGPGKGVPGRTLTKLRFTDNRMSGSKSMIKRWCVRPRGLWLIDRRTSTYANESGSLSPMQAETRIDLHGEQCTTGYLIRN